MMQENMKRCLSLILAMVLTFSLLPVSALASEGEAHSETIAMETTSPLEVAEAPLETPEVTTIPVTEETVPVTTVPVTEETVPETTSAPVMVVEETAPVIAASSNKNAVQAAMDAIVGKYLDLTKVLTAEDVAEAVAEMDEDTWFEALIEVEDLEYSDAIHALTEEELLELTEKNPLFCAFAEAVYERAAMPGDAGLYTTVNVLDGQVSITDSANSNTVSNGIVTIQAKGGLLSKKTNNITITNESDSTANLSFDYTVSKANSFTIAGVAPAASGSYTVMLDAGASLAIVLISNSGFSNTTATLTLSNFALIKAASSSNVTIVFDSALGSVTAGGSAVTSGTTQEVSLADGIALVATSKSGCTFLGWINVIDGNIVSTSTSYTLKPAEDMTIKAVFASATSKAWFLVDSKYLTDDLTVAVGLGTKIFLAHDGTLNPRLAEDGTTKIAYEIPSGVTLLIPCDSAYSMTTTTPNRTEPAKFADTPPAVTSYRKLTMAQGSNITVNGAISIAGTQRAGGLYVSATGAAGFIHMNSGSSITVNSGGFLYAWGYITGSGSVVVESGGTIYEQFQIAGWRGGDMTSTMVKSNKYGVFPMSQYYVQNIEVPLTLKKGAMEYTYACVDISIIGMTPISVAFVGSGDSMFKISSGYVIKDYIENEDRLKLTVYGDVSLSPITIDMKLGLLGSIELKSQNFDLPINHNMTIHGVSGSLTLNQDVVLLPGTQFIIDEGVTCSVGSGINVYIYDADQWGAYCGSVNKNFIAVSQAPGRTKTRTDADLVDASICINGTFDVSQGYVYTTTGGANIYSTDSGIIKTQIGTQTVTHQVKQAGEPADSAYPEIPITPAKLKNGDGKYTETAGDTATYVYSGTGENGKWYKEFSISYASMTMANSLDMNFAFEKDLREDWTGYYAEIVKDYADGSQKKQTIPYGKDWKTATINGKEHYYVTFTGIAAKEMSDLIHVTIKNAQGTPVSGVWEDSVQLQAMRNLEQTGSDLTRKMVVDMLNYGTEAQNTQNYNKSNLANSKLNDTQKTWATASVALSDNSIRPTDGTYMANVKLVSNIQFMMLFKGIEPSMTAQITFKDHYGNDKSYSIPGSEFNHDANTGSYYFIIEETVIADGQQEIKCKIVNSQNEPVVEVTDSIGSYAARASETDKPLYEMIMKFSDSAYKYLHDKLSQ